METSRKNIAHGGIITAKYADYTINADDISRGEKLLADAGCRRCHIAGGKGETAAISLDVSARENTAEYLAEKIRNVNEYMPAFRFGDDAMTMIIKYLLRQGDSADDAEGAPLVVYIQPVTEGVFEKHCGDCHKLLTRKGGGKGSGNIARNLSGLFSDYFRSDVLPAGERWTDRKLLDWVVNPRQISKTAIMPPVFLTREEEQDLLKEFRN